MGRNGAQFEREGTSTNADEVVESWLRRVASVDSSVLSACLPVIGQVIADKYRIEACLGHGGMGAVYRAVHVVSHKPVAVKWMLRSTLDENARGRFLKEAHAAARIDHPNVIDVYDLGEEGPCAYLVMELLHGQSLRERLASGPLSLTEVVNILLPALRGVAAAHRAGVIHRDLKPDNIFLCTDPYGQPREAKVLDFGVAAVLDGAASNTTLTETGAVLGTPMYMSPEQLQAASDIDARTDVYALGVILYEALTGSRPFEANSYAALVMAVLQRAPTPPRAQRSDVPQALEAVVLRALEKDRDKRYVSVDALIDALTHVESEEPQRHPKSDTEITLGTWLAAAGVVLACVAASSLLWIAPAPTISPQTPTSAMSSAAARQATEVTSPYLPSVMQEQARSFATRGAPPSSCEQAKQQGRSQDGATLIDPDGAGPVGAFEVFCAGMASVGAGPPREYLTLMHGGHSGEPSMNSTRFVYGSGQCACPDLVGHFARVRLEPRSLSVDPTDTTFTRYDRPLSCEREHRIHCGERTGLAWGGAGSCRAEGDTSGSATIDLRGTPFALSPAVRFVPAGFGAAGSAMFSPDRKTASLVGGGRCGALAAEQASIALVMDR